MAQITSGVRAIFSNPSVYSVFQNIMGAHRSRTDLVEGFIKPFPGCAILDIGCGPADILAYFPETDYWGYDISDVYIAKAKKRFGTQGHFFCKELTASDLQIMPKFDIVLAL